MTFAAAAIPLWSAIHPVVRPITSITMMRPWAVVVLTRRSMHSVANETAESNPVVWSVCSRSWSMVFGTPMTGTPSWLSRWAMDSEPSPPTATMTSTCRSRSRSATSWPRPVANGLPRLVVPSIVPPRWVMSRTASRSRVMTPPVENSPS
ncbi:MAG: hypothetical protein V9G12_17380 [Microthrixaceae bacterium]